MRSRLVALLVGLVLLATAAPLVGSGTTGAQAPAPATAQTTSVSVLPSSSSMVVGKSYGITVPFASPSKGTVRMEVSEGLTLRHASNCQPIKGGTLCVLKQKLGMLTFRVAVGEGVGEQVTLSATLKPNKKGTHPRTGSAVVSIIRLG